jgi:hypothetical protein
VRKVLYFLGQLSDRDVEWLIARGIKQRVPAGSRFDLALERLLSW